MDYEGEDDYECPVCGFTYHDDDYDDDGNGERLSVYEAAEIWAFKGKDEDYMFGYSGARGTFLLSWSGLYNVTKYRKSFSVILSFLYKKVMTTFPNI